MTWTRRRISVIKGEAIAGDDMDEEED